MIKGNPTRDIAPPRPLRPVRDLSGVHVRDASGIPIGELWGALVDGETGLIRYLDVSLEHAPRHVLVPIGHARLRQGEGEGDPEVRLRAALLEELTHIPPFQPADAIDDTYEDELLRAHGELFHGQRYYAHPAFDHRGLYAGEHPISRDEGARADSGLQPLRSLSGYRLARDEPDVRSWPLVGDASEQLGVITDLIVDVDAEDVRYIVVERDGRCAVLPIGFLELDIDAERVLAPGMRGEDLGNLPQYDGGPVERVFEDHARNALEERFRGARRYQLPDYRRGSAV